MIQVNKKVRKMEVLNKIKDLQSGSNGTQVNYVSIGPIMDVTDK